MGRGCLPALPKETCGHNHPIHPSCAHTRRIHPLYHAPSALRRSVPHAPVSHGKQCYISIPNLGVSSLTRCIIRFLTGRVSRPRLGHQTPPPSSIEKHFVLSPTLYTIRAPFHCSSSFSSIPSIISSTAMCSTGSPSFNILVDSHTPSPSCSAPDLGQCHEALHNFSPGPLLAR
jgi:hypothetical protein